MRSKLGLTVASGPKNAMTARLVGGVLGLVAFSLGAVAVFVTTNSSGAAALIAVGAALIALSLFTDRIESIEAAGVKLGLQRQARGKLQEADLAEIRGDTEVAQDLREQAEAILSTANAVSRGFESVRAAGPSGWERTRRLEEKMHEARQLASSTVWTPDQVRQLFTSGPDGNRLTALGLMQSDPKLVQFDLLAQAIVDRRSRFEQYHVLKTGLDAFRGADIGETGAWRNFVVAVRSFLDGAAASELDGDRVQLARQIIDMMNRPEPSS